MKTTINYVGINGGNVKKEIKDEYEASKELARNYLFGNSRTVVTKEKQGSIYGR